MQEKNNQQWFFQELSKSAFFIYSASWLILFLLEVIKSGLVSNYFSLTHAVLPLIVLGVLWLALLPSEELQPEQVVTPFPIRLLLVISIALVVLIVFTIEASNLLTLLIIFATLAALWGGVYSFWNQSN